MTNIDANTIDIDTITWEQATALTPRILSHKLEPDADGDCRVYARSDWPTDYRTLQMWTDYRRGECPGGNADHPSSSATRAALQDLDRRKYWVADGTGGMAPCDRAAWLADQEAAAVKTH